MSYSLFALSTGEFDGLRRRNVGSSHADRAAVHERGSENRRKAGGSLEDKFNQTIKNSGFAPAWIVMNKDIRSDMHKWRRVRTYILCSQRLYLRGEGKRRCARVLGSAIFVPPG